MDSMSFIGAGLESSISELAKSGHTFDIVKASGLAKNDHQLTLLLKKGQFSHHCISLTIFFIMQHTTLNLQDISHMSTPDLSAN